MAYIVLEKKNFFNNLDIIAQKTKSKDKIALVLKDNAYGHGLKEVASMAAEYGITKAVVRTTKEAQEIATLFDYILVLADIPHKKTNFHYALNSLEAIGKFPKKSKVELKVDTGMHRNGIAYEDLERAFERIVHQELILTGVFSHHRSADEISAEWFWQNENFKRVKQKVNELAKRFDIPLPQFHMDNSASLMRKKYFDEDMARIGIAAYGALEMPRAFGDYPLQPVLSVFAKKIATQKLTPAKRVGYGGCGKVATHCSASAYDIGYGDGFFRSLSHTYTTPKNIAVIGRISMDNTLFASDEEEILIFDDARKVARTAGTISYEILTALKSEIPRIVR